MPFHLVLLLLFIVGIGLLGLAVSGYGSPDRSRELPARLPGHDIQDELRRRDDPDAQ